MSTALKIFQGKFGRVSLLDMSKPLVTHAHHHCHALIKVSGVDSAFIVKGRKQPLTDDSVVLVNAWEPHAYAHTDHGQGRCILMAFYLEPSWLAEILQALTVSSHPQFFPRSCALLPPAARRLTNALAAEMMISDDMPADMLESRIFDVFIATVEHNSELRNFNSLLYSLRGKPADPRIRRAITTMQANLMCGLDMDRLAADCGLSRAHFFELFKSSTRLTPGVYANVLRVESAIKGLSDRRQNISDIAYDIGFSAPAHFTRFFRQHLGITPSDYRRAVDIVCQPGHDAMPLP